MSKSYNQRSFLVHPSGMILILILCGVSALFGALSLAYVYTRVDKGMDSIHVPLLFVFNSVVLAFSSFSIHMCRRYFDRRHELLCFRWGVTTVFATVLFLILQGIAWYQLLTKSLLPGTSGGLGFLYAISILHFLHVIAGIPFLIRVLVPLLISIRQGSAVLFFIDDDQRRRLKYTAWYWHFIDVVWIYLILFFVLNSLL